jgi:hydroxyacylglutathione hydrolase
MLTIAPIPAFNDNYIWTMFDRSRGASAVVVDPGDATPVEAFLNAHRLDLAAVIITHHHADHTGGISALTQHREIPVYGPGAESIVGVTHALREGDTIKLPDIFDATLRAIEVPGHTRGHIAYVADGADGFVLCGDTLFAAGCGRLFEGTPAQMYASLAKLAALPPGMRVYCTHEYTMANLRFACAVDPDNELLQTRVFEDSAKRERNEPTVPTTIARELSTNPFLRCEEPAIVAAASRFRGLSLSDPVEVFAAIREWKNRFA